MDKALRTSDGDIISEAHWKAIKQSARSAIGTFLSHIKAEKPSKRYFRNHHTAAWNKAINHLEISRPIVALCAGHWKAEHVINSVLTSDRSSASRSRKRKPVDSDEGEKFQLDGDNDGDEDNDEDNDDKPVVRKKRATGALTEHPTKKLKTQQPAAEKKKARGGSLIGDILYPNTIYTETSKPMPSVEALVNRQNHGKEATQAASITLDLPGGSSTTPLDISFIRVDTNCKYLLTQLCLTKYFTIYQSLPFVVS